MPLHDWTRVSPNDYHDMHQSWLTFLRTRLNTDVLPAGYYAMSEHVTPPFAPDVLTLGGGPGDTAEDFGGPASWSDGGGGGGAVATETETEVEATVTTTRHRRLKRPARRIVVRHVEGRRLVAVIELVSPGNKAKAKEIVAFVGKAAALIEAGVHVTVIDPFPNPKAMPQGFGGRVLRALGQKVVEYAPTFSRTHASFAARADGGCVARLQSSEVGQPLPPLFLFLTATRGVTLPLEETYQAAWAGYPKPLRAPLEAPPS